MSEPPYIVLHTCGSVQIQHRLPDAVDANRAAIVSRYWEGLSFFRADGVCLSVAPSNDDLPAATFLNRVLSCFYNPTRKLHFTYTEVGPYDLETLKDTIMDYVGRDDDILTQFMDAAQIKRALKAAADFPRVVDVLERMSGKGY